MRSTWFATAYALLLLSPSALALASTDGDTSSRLRRQNSHVVARADSTDEEPPAESFNPCTTRSPNTGSFFDLNPIKAVLPPEKAEERKKFYGSWGESIRNTSWHARGYDYGANFTINFCAPVIERHTSVVNVSHHLWKDVAAFYILDNKTYSIGNQNDELVFRGRKMTLNYTNGSPCPPFPDIHHKRQSVDGAAPARRTKTTLISLLCERDPMAPSVSIAFVGTADECTYFFEARTKAACPAINSAQQQVGPSGVFGLIFVIALLVYVVGGVVYQRAVLHQRGWRQLPNYNLWASIAQFMKDVLFIFFSTCIQCVSAGGNDSKSRGTYGQMPNGSGGYNSAGGHGVNGYAYGPSSASPHFGSAGARGAGGGGFGRATGHSSNLDDESTLIDQLDEVWDD